MTITKKDFNKVEHKVITLMGMSSVGKTYLSSILRKDGWFHHSCDLRIGTKYLGDEIEKTLGKENRVTADDLSQLTNYISCLGNGKLSLDEFKRRQNQYIQAERQSLRDLQGVVKEAVADGHTHVINDSTGSFCEIDNDVLLDNVDKDSLIVYIKANETEEKEVLKRAQEYPKPMYFSSEKLDTWIAQYAMEHKFKSTDEFNSKDFSRWVFPKLFENRLPKYQAIADKYGVTIPSKEFRNIKTADEFLEIVVRYLPDEYE